MWGWYWGATGIRARQQGSRVWNQAIGSVLLGPGFADLGLGSGPGTGGCARGAAQRFGAQSSACWPPPPPGLRGWERTAVPCVRSLLGLPTGGNVVFSSRSCRSGRAEGLGVRGQAGLGTHTAPLCSLNEVLAVPWPGLAPLPPLRGGLGLYLAPVGTELPPAGSPLPGLGAGGVPGHHPWAGGWGLRGGDAGMASAPHLGHRGSSPSLAPAGGHGHVLGAAWGFEGVLGEAAKGGGFGKGGPERAPWCCGAQHPFCKRPSSWGSRARLSPCALSLVGLGRARRGRQPPAADGLLSPPRARLRKRSLLWSHPAFN